MKPVIIAITLVISALRPMPPRCHAPMTAAAHFGVSVSFVVNLVKAFRMRGRLAPKPQLMELETDRQISASGL